MITPKKIIIVGGNAAGAAAAAKSKRINPQASVILFEASDYISTGTCEIPYVISGEISSYQNIVYYTAQKFFEEKGVRVFVNHLVESINRKEKFISVKDLKSSESKIYNYDTLVLSTGSSAKRLPDLLNNPKNIFTLKNIQDLKNIIDYSRITNVKRGAIFGSGYIGLEAAEAFKKNGAEVVIIEKEKLPMPSAEIEVRSLILELLKQKGVEFYGKIDHPKFNYLTDKIQSITIESRILEFDLIISAIGFQPCNILAIQSKLEIGIYGGIKVDRKLKTCDADIFAAGDNIEVINAITRKPEYIPLATVAHEYGHIAGENAAGGNMYVEPVVKNIGVKIFNKFLTIVGLTSMEAYNFMIPFNSVEEVATNLVKVMPNSQKVFGKIIYRKHSKKLLGASFFGGREVAGYADLISLLISTNQPADILSQVNYNYSPPLSPFINLLSILGRKIK